MVTKVIKRNKEVVEFDKLTSTNLSLPDNTPDVTLPR